MTVFPMSDKEETCIRIPAGDTFALRFLTRPGTGYSWEFAEEPDKNLLQFIETRNEEAEKSLLGGSEFSIWIFKALAAGKTSIYLKYVRPWEKDAAPVQKHVFKVQIQ